MEFPHLGKQCHKSDCKDLDFLPISCTYCKGIFCQNHFQVSSHQCPNVVDSRSDGTSDKKNPNCSFPRCNVKDVVEMKCIKCHQHFCLLHRYHDCFAFSEKEMEQARKQLREHREKFAASLEKVSNQITVNIEKNKKKDKNRAMALKVNLMRLKNKAVGSSSLPENERLYLLIYPPLRCELKSKAVFVSKTWSIGRVIDSIAALCNVTNRNNESTADKLRLFWKSNGTEIHNDLSVKISDIIADDQNGESLILEYVNGSNFDNVQMINHNDYKE